MMSRPKLDSTDIRKLKSAGRTIVRTTVKATDKAASGLLRWAAKEHTGLASRVCNMPTLGLADTIGYLLLQVLVVILGAIFTGVWVFILVAYGIPLFLFGHL